MSDKLSKEDMVSPERRRVLMQCGAAGLLFCLPGSLYGAESERSYKETTAVLQIAYANEFSSREHYRAFAQQAIRDGHPNIAHLFSALAASEAVHVRNYSKILQQLGVKPVRPDVSATKIGSTRENLHYAAEDELAEVDKQYPELLARLQPEGHVKAMEKVGWSWQAEKQHRELISDILSGTGIFFGVLSERFRQTTVRYFVCENCGSTLIELPGEKCPVCDEPVEVYREIKRIA